MMCQIRLLKVLNIWNYPLDTHVLFIPTSWNPLPTPSPIFLLLGPSCHSATHSVSSEGFTVFPTHHSLKWSYICFLFIVHPHPTPIYTSEQRPHLPCSSVSFFSAWRIVDAQYLLLGELHLGLLPTHPLLCSSPAFSVYLPALSDLCPVVNVLSLCLHSRLSRFSPLIPCLITIINLTRLPPGRKPAVLIGICSDCPPAHLSLTALHSEVRGSEGALLLVSPGGQDKWCTFYVNMVIWGWVCNPCCVLGPSEPQLHPENML